MSGFETTSNSTSWAMYSLATHPEILKKLRDELLEVPTDTPTLDQLNACTYLDQVTREVLRFHTVVTHITREATQDDVIPLDKPALDRHGNTITHIK